MAKLLQLRHTPAIPGLQLVIWSARPFVTLEKKVCNSCGKRETGDRKAVSKVGGSGSATC